MKVNKILFIGTGFYDYDEYIKQEINNLGIDVVYFSSSFKGRLEKILRKFHLYSIIKIIQTHIIKKKLFQTYNNDIDKILIIKAEGFTQKSIGLLGQLYKNKPIVLYLWDSLKNHENHELLLKSFDNIVTFDKKDAEIYSLKFRPLFYRSECEIIRNESIDNIYDIVFFGFWHSNRYELLSKIRKEAKELNLSCCFRLQTSYYKYIINRYVKRIIRSNDSDLFYFESYPYSKILNIISKSKIILDISHPLQSGLTMRTIEAIGMKKNLLTTNSNIVEYSNIDKNTYLILDANNPILNRNDILQLTRNNNSTDREYYSIRQFLKELLN